MFKSFSAASLTLGFLAGGAATVLGAGATFTPMIGTWAGNGTIKLENGQTEAVKCKAYYTDKAPGLGVAVRCASSASKIDLRATLATAGAKVTGTWEERQFNAGGSLTGAAVGNKLSLDMDGGGLKALVVVATTGASQTLSITADAGGFRSVSIAFAREP
jgi:hypothetical protein